MRVVIDSNVVVSAMLSPHTPPAQVVRLALQGDVGLLHDARILAEYREVLSRPKFGFDAEDVHAMLEGIEWIGETVFASPLSVELPDPGDLPFLEVAAAAGADALVTGNTRHYRPAKGRHDVSVLTPRELLDLLAEKRDHARP
jgi:putative PIN family toxin of toxin-antitoxin system